MATHAPLIDHAYALLRTRYLMDVPELLDAIDITFARGLLTTAALDDLTAFCHKVMDLPLVGDEGVTP